jgi:hypothetical protein
VDAVSEGRYRLMFLDWYDLAQQPSHHAARASEHKLIPKCISLSALTSYPITDNSSREMLPYSFGLAQPSFAPSNTATHPLPLLALTHLLRQGQELGAKDQEQHGLPKPSANGNPVQLLCSPL